MLEANTKIQVTLTAEQWNTTLAFLREGPHRIVDPIVNELLSQCQSVENSMREQLNELNDRPTRPAKRDNGK